MINAKSLTLTISIPSTTQEFRPIINPTFKLGDDNEKGKPLVLTTSTMKSLVPSKVATMIEEGDLILQSLVPLAQSNQPSQLI
jgi:hypothetical protein